MSKKINVKLKQNSYNIYAGTSYLECYKYFPIGTGKRILIVTDKKIGPMYAYKLREELNKKNYISYVFEIAIGEETKNLNTVTSIHEECARLNIDRKCLIIALGGGVVGDITGFAASIYLRGIPFAQIPTTVLAQVDAGIGGKTGVDTIYGKNQIGTFYQPKFVLLDYEFLNSLDEREYKNGLAEVVKYAVIDNKCLFKFIEKNINKILDRNKKVLEYLIYSCAKIKARVVSLDEFEKNLRRVLNFGHTLGHAIESYEEYKGLKHGEAVGIGMAFDAYLGVKLKKCNEKVVRKIEDVLKNLNFDIENYKRKFSNKEFNLDKIIDIIKYDKKIESDNVKMYLPTKIGKVKDISISTNDIKKYLEEWK
jgi:3-dehydroquinate synthase